jgi:2-polyprenyl-3-methyl-5-hydroxy-6-metoxy-1,4-benzoquinol methylase
VTSVLDPEGAHLAALRRLARLEGAAIVEVGCGEGRLTESLAGEADFVFAFDPDRDAVASARERLLPALDCSVSFAVGRARDVEIPPQPFDLVFFSWSL